MSTRRPRIKSAVNLAALANGRRKDRTPGTSAGSNSAGNAPDKAQPTPEDKIVPTDTEKQPKVNENIGKRNR